MVLRIIDLRIEQAQRHGRIVGLPKVFAEEVAALADFLLACHMWSDVILPFDGEVIRHGGGRWRIPMKGRSGWWMTFKWMRPFGPIELELWREQRRRAPRPAAP